MRGWGVGIQVQSPTLYSDRWILSTLATHLNTWEGLGEIWAFMFWFNVSQLLYKIIKTHRHYDKMTEEDIYKNGKKYERFKANLKSLTTPPQTGDQRKYYCKNSKNLKYFEKLFIHFESRDLSYIRRNRVLDTMKVIVHSIPKDLSHCDRDDINRTMACMHNRYKSVETKKSFIKDLKYIWKILFPELDEKGRPDERIVPYVVRHISGKIDVSKIQQSF